MTRLSVNINKVATLRNSRGGNLPDLLKVAVDCERFGSGGITVHPRPDERHIKYQDVFDLKSVVKTELNIEGYPSPKFMNLVSLVKPTQVTLVPDPPNALTSNAGWDTVKNESLLLEIINELKRQQIRTSIFVDTNTKFIENAAKLQAERIELYTEEYAKNFQRDKKKAIKPYADAAECANELGLGLNAGHDLNLHNLNYFRKNIPNLLEVSIGHALICDALYYGLENTIQLYLRQLQDT